jgi:DNA-binding IclR family transcriptional regulator
MNNTLIKGLQLLEVIARSKQPLGITDLAVRLGLGKSNVHRLLQALVDLGYVTKLEARGEYHVSLKLWELGHAVETGLAIKNAASEAMDQLLHSTRETVHLSVLDGDQVVYVHKLDSPEPVRAYSEVGGRAPAYCVATGKALLAWQPESFLAGMAGRLEAHTPKTITDPKEFLRELERIRLSGFAVNRGEWRESVWGVAAPVRNEEGIVAAIGISGPSSRIKPSQIKSLAAEVMTAADAVSRRLDGH